MNLPAGADELRRNLQAVWQADETMTDWPAAETADLVAQRYSQESWNHLR